MDTSNRMMTEDQGGPQRLLKKVRRERGFDSHEWEPTLTRCLGRWLKQEAFGETNNRGR